MPHKDPTARRAYEQSYRERRKARSEAVKAAKAAGLPSPFATVAAQHASRNARYHAGDVVRWRDRSSRDVAHREQLARIERVCGMSEHDGMMYMAVVSSGSYPIYDSEIVERISGTEYTAQREEQAG